MLPISLASLLVVSFGPIDVDERDLTAPVCTMVTLENNTDQPRDAVFKLHPSGWTTRAGASSGRQRVRPHHQAVILITGRLGDSLYPLPWVATKWTGAGGPETTVRTVALVRKVAECRRIREAVVEDGVLGEECWLLGRRFGHFGTERGKKPVNPSPQWMAAYDDTALYLGVICPAPNDNAWQAHKRPRDAPEVAQDESVEVFLSPSTHRADYFHLALNTAGSVLDERCFADGRRPDRTWNSNVHGAVRSGRRGYYVELSLPVSSLDVESPDTGTVWLINVARNQRLPGSAAPVRTLWNANPRGSLNVAAFGALVFK